MRFFLSFVILSLDVQVSRGEDVGGIVDFHSLNFLFIILHCIIVYFKFILYTNMNIIIFQLY